LNGLAACIPGQLAITAVAAFSTPHAANCRAAASTFAVWVVATLWE